MAVKVFLINDDEWWAGECTPEDILKAYMEAYGCTHEDATGDEADFPTPLTEEQLDLCFFGADENGQRLATPITFRQYLDKMVARGDQFPCLFASTNV